MAPFHLAFPVADLDEARRFYRDVLGCGVGRESAGHWIDFDLFGHQLTAHLRPGHRGSVADSVVDDEAVPIPHFGVVLSLTDWQALADRLEADQSVRWGLRPKTRFEGRAGEQRTFFIYDPSGNALEFKGFARAGEVFRS